MSTRTTTTDRTTRDHDVTTTDPTAPSSQATTRTVTVAMLTYKRPDDLRSALPLVCAQLPQEHAELLVVDNDPDGGARHVVEAAGDRRIRYVHEPTPGIAAARNRALAETASDVLVFIDDDERPSEAWLSSLLAVHARERCAAVVGPVVSEYEIEPEPWIREGGFFDRRRPATGAVVEAAATNNLLLDMAVVRRLGLEFDVRYGLTGGSDTLFTRRLSAAGERIVWCAEAPVVDVVPRGRLTRRWVLQKALRSGNSWSRTSLELAPRGLRRVPVRLRLLGEGLVRVGGGAGRLALGKVTRNRRHEAGGSRVLARGAGLVSGAVGWIYTEYRRPTTKRS